MPVLCVLTCGPGRKSDLNATNVNNNYIVLYSKIYGQEGGWPGVFTERQMLFTTYKDQYIRNLRLAAPVILAHVGNVTVQFVDNAMVGRLGALPMAGVAFGGTVFFMVFIFVMGISMGLTPLVGEQYVQGHYRKAAAYLQNSFLLFFIAGLASFAVQYSMIPLMFLMGQPPEVVEVAIPYYKYLVWSIIPFMVFASFKQFLEGVGNTSINMTIIITCNLINIFFNWLLIYGNWGFPRMEVVGAGISTLISRTCMPLMAAGYFFFKPRLRRYFRYFRWSDISRSYIKPLLLVGLPISAQMFLEGAAFALTSIMIGWIGTIAIAANQIAIVIAHLAFMIVIGIGEAATIRVSHEYGRNNFRELKKAANASYHMTLAWNVVTAILFISLRYQIPRIFTDDPEVILLAGHLLIFVAAFQISDGIQSVSVGILRGLQDVKSVMGIAFFSYLVINLPVGYLCAFVLGFGAGGLWTGFIFGLTIAAVLLVVRFRRQYTLLRREHAASRRQYVQ